MYMRSLPTILEFDWDEGNLDKSYEKHGVSPKESEEAFISEDLYVQPDKQHSQTEERFIAVGKTLAGKHLFITFTLRGEKTRIISARHMHRKEIDKYEKIKKNP